MRLNIKNIVIITLLLAFLPLAAKANVGLGKPNTAGSTVLVIYNPASTDGGWDAEIAFTGATCLYNLLTSTNNPYNTGLGFNFTVTTLQVPWNFNNCVGCFGTTAASAVQNGINTHVILPLVNTTTGNPNYCIVFDMRFLDYSNAAPYNVAGQVLGDTITPGDISLYQAYLAAGGSLFILGDNFWGGSESGFISREENMNQMINSVALTGIGVNSDNIISEGTMPAPNYPANVAAAPPYGLGTNYNNLTGITLTTDFPGPIVNSAGGLGSGEQWVVMTPGNWPGDSDNVLSAVWTGGDFQAAYSKGSMMYWGDSNVLQGWASSGPSLTDVSEFMENAITWLYNGNCCTPPSTLACPSGTDVQTTPKNPVVDCFSTGEGLDGWTSWGTASWDNTQDFNASGGGSMKVVSGALWNNQALFTSPTFAAGTLSPYEGICFEVKNSTTGSITFDVLGTGTSSPYIISTTSAAIPNDGAWHEVCLTFNNQFIIATNVEIENTAASATGQTGDIWLDAVRLQSSCNPYPMVADPACCGVVDTPTFTNTATKTYTATFTSTPTLTFTKTYTATFTNTFTATPTNTLANSPTFTNTFTSTPTLTFTNTPLNTFTFTNTYTSTPTSTYTNTPVNTFTFTNTYTSTPTQTFTNTPQNSFTFTNTFTNTPTLTYTNTPVNTFTFTNTFTNTPTQTYTNTFVNSPTFTNTFTNTYTPTFTNTPVNTFTFTNTFTSTNTSTPTLTFTITPTNTPTMTFTVTPTPASFVGFGKTVSETQANAGDVLTYMVAVTVSGSALTNAVITDVLPANMTFQAFGSMPAGTTTTNSNPPLLQWNLPSPLATGIYDLTYQTKVNTFAPANVPLTNNAQLTYAGGGPFKASVPVTVIGQFSVAVNIYNSAGEVIKTIPIQYFSTAINNIVLSTTNTITTLTGPGSTIDILFNGYVIGVWNGTNNSNQPVSNGSYQIQIDNVSAAGVVTSVSQNAIVSRNLSSVEVDIFNEAGEIVRKLYNVVANPTSSNMTNVVLSSTAFQPNANNVQNGSTLSQLQILVQDTNSPVTLMWDGSNNTGTYVTPGIYDIEVHWTNGNGTTTDITRTVRVLQSKGVSGIMVARPNILNSVNGMTTTFDATGVVNASALKVKIYTIAGELVQAFVSGSTTAPWNASGLASGIYIADVEVDNASGGAINNQRLKILVLH